MHFVDIKKFSFFSSSLGLWYVVQRTKQCLDYTCTVHLFHVIFCWYFNGVLPNYLSWWIINLIWLGLCVLNFLSIISEFFWREKLTQKWLELKAEQFSKFQFLNDKIDHNTNFALFVLPRTKRLFFYNSTSYLQLLSFSLNHLRNFLTRETDTKMAIAKSWAIFKTSILER